MTDVVNNVVVVLVVLARLAVDVVKTVDIEVLVNAAKYVTKVNAELCSVVMPVELIDVVVNVELIPVVVVKVAVELVST